MTKIIIIFGLLIKLALFVFCDIGYCSNLHFQGITAKPLESSGENRSGDVDLSINNHDHTSLSLYDTKDAPVNDSCSNAEIITGLYPVSGTGTTIESTIDCPSLLFWEGVWYKISLPYAYNDMTVTLCGLNEGIVDAGVIMMDDCLCDDLIGANSFEFLDEGQCSTGNIGIELTFNSIPDNLNDEAVIYWPVWAINDNSENMDFTYIIDIDEGNPPPPGDNCSDPITIESFPFIDSLNSCDFNNDYNFGGEDIIYRFYLDGCYIIEISLCNTEPVFDTYLLIYDENSCGGIPIATDDDSCMPSGQYGTSSITDTLDEGTFYIAVDAYPTECGEYILEVTANPCPALGACCIDIDCVGTTYEIECDSLDGSWYEGENCDSAFTCPVDCYEYLVGDANMIVGQWPPQIIGSDVTFLVNYFRGVVDPCLINGFFASGDANGDCIVIGSDVTRLVNFFRGITITIPCPGYEPCWLTPDMLPVEPPPDWPDCFEER